MASRIGKGGWLFLYIVTGIIDVVQFLIGFFGAWLSLIAIGAFLVAINEAADPFIGVALAAYFQLRGVSLIQHPSRLLSLIGVAGFEEITGGIAPFWIVDVWYIHRTVKKEEAETEAAEAGDPSRREPDIQAPAVKNGRRERSSNVIDVDFGTQQAPERESFEEAA